MSLACANTLLSVPWIRYLFYQWSCKQEIKARANYVA